MEKKQIQCLWKSNEIARNQLKLNKKTNEDLYQEIEIKNTEHFQQFVYHLDAKKMKINKK